MTKKTQVQIQVEFAPPEKFVLTPLCKRIDRDAFQGGKNFQGPVFPGYRIEDHSPDLLTVTLTGMVL